MPGHPLLPLLDFNTALTPAPGSPLGSPSPLGPGKALGRQQEPRRGCTQCNLGYRPLPSPGSRPHQTRTEGCPAELLRGGCSEGCRLAGLTFPHAPAQPKRSRGRDHFSGPHASPTASSNFCQTRLLPPCSNGMVTSLPPPVSLRCRSHWQGLDVHQGLQASSQHHLPGSTWPAFLGRQPCCDPAQPGSRM